MIRIEKIVIVLLYPILVVDALNGYLIRNFHVDLSLSQAYKMFIILLLLPVIMKDKKYNLYLMATTLLFSLILFYHLSNYKKMNYLVSDIVLVTKLLFPLMIFLFFKRCFSLYTHAFVIGSIRKIFTFSYLVVILNMMLTVLGVGYQTTESFGGFGGVGFFYSGNALSSTFIIIAAFLCYQLWMSRHYTLYLLFCTMTVAFSFVLETKTAIFFSLFLFLLMPLVEHARHLMSLRFSLKFAAFGLLFAGAVVLASTQILNADLGVVKKFKYFYEKQGLVFALFTGRNVFLYYSLKVFTKNYDFFDQLFGKGLLTAQKEIGGYYSTEKIVEMDFFDVLLSYGILGVIITYSIWLHFFKKSFQNFSSQVLSRFLFTVNCIVLAISFFAGHVLFEGLCVLYIGMLNALVYYDATSEEVGNNEDTANQQLSLHPRW